MNHKVFTVKKSRREFLKYMSVLGIGSFYTVPLYAKTLKETVKYQEVPNQGKRCIECLHFIPATNECTTVEGSIDPNGWCIIYFKNPNYKEVKTVDNNNQSAPL